MDKGRVLLPWVISGLMACLAIVVAVSANRPAPGISRVPSQASVPVVPPAPAAVPATAPAANLAPARNAAPCRRTGFGPSVGATRGRAGRANLGMPNEWSEDVFG